MKIKKLQWNITILTLFILLGSALLGVLVALYMKNFIKYSENISNYERVNYLAKAGTELWLAIVGIREPWLELTIESDHQFMKENFDCPTLLKDWEDCPYQPTFSLSISGLNQKFNSCDESKKIKVWAGLSVIIPLFKDSGISDINDILQKGSQQGTIGNFKLYGKKDEWKYAIVSFLNNQLSIQVQENINYISWGPQKYLVIANPNNSDQELCLENPNGIPQENIKIISIGFFKGTQFWTETLAKQALPDFLQGDNYLR